MTELREDQALERVVRIHDIGPVVVKITSAGIEFRVKGAKKHITTNWITVVNNSQTGTDVPSYLYGNPVALLQHETAAVAKRAAEKVK